MPGPLPLRALVERAAAQKAPGRRQAVALGAEKGGHPSGGAQGGTGSTGSAAGAGGGRCGTQWCIGCVPERRERRWQYREQ